MDQVVISNIQRMCFQDGPGIRTTVFFKGCNLHCPWCSNPENISGAVQVVKNSGGHELTYGKYYDSDSPELMEEILKDRAFWGEDGGVTFSGGEPLLQLMKLIPLLAYLRQERIHMAIETALMVPEQNLELVLPFLSLAIVDIKVLTEQCSEILGGSVLQYKNNLKLLKESGISVLFRIPCSKPYVLSTENIKIIKQMLKDWPDADVEIFPLHDLGRSKYLMLGKEFPIIEEVSEQELVELEKQLTPLVHSVRINRI